MSIRRITSALLLTVALTTACTSGSDDDTTTTTTDGSAGTPTTVAGPVVPELLEPGAEPRQALRFTFTEGAVTTADLTVETDVEQSVGGRTQSLDTPPIVQTMAITTDRVTDQGAELSFEVTAASVDRTETGLDPSALDDMDAAVADLVGLAGAMTVSDTGAASDVSYEIPDDADEQTTTLLEQLEGQVAGLTVPLPTEPVGVGARWQATTPFRSSGIVVEQTTTYEITAIEGTSVTYAATVEQTGERQDIELGGVEAELVSSDVQGTAEGTIALDAPIAPSSSTLSGRQVIAVSTGDTTQDLEQTLEISLTIVLRDA